jgi:hypothetical protein
VEGRKGDVARRASSGGGSRNGQVNLDMIHLVWPNDLAAILFSTGTVFYDRHDSGFA